MIKFRAWDKKEKKMTYFNLDWSLMQGGWYDFPGGEDAIENHLMQFTGLKDKNGKEIYEGDIIRDKKDKERKNLSIVEWVGDVVGWRKADIQCDVIYQPELIDRGSFSIWKKHKSMWSEDEVIGNIYENPVDN